MKYISKNLINKEMNNKTYDQRRKVISLIYRAKKLVPSLPRIAVHRSTNTRE